MRIVVTGKQGQVVQSLAERGPVLGHEIVPLGRPQLDLAGEPSAIVDAIEASAPDVIVSAAAYTAVDKAESEPELAFAINARGAESVAHAAKRLGVPLIHLSTDYVFDGSKAGPYVENDPTGPASVYGASKLEGEQAILRAHDDVAILRTAWVYSPFGANFVKTMLRLSETRDEVSVVADQQGNPTSAIEIADAVIAVAERLATDRDLALRGIYHMAGSGAATWADVAEEVFAAAGRFGGRQMTVRRIATEDYPTPARRPANSQLDGSKLAAAYGVWLPEWRKSVHAVVERLKSAPARAPAEVSQ